VISGIAADRPMIGNSVVAAVNGALEALVRALALELSPARANALSPGWVDTPAWDKMGVDKAERLAARAKTLPVRRVGTPDDLAAAALFLIENGYTTGEVLHVDGGHRVAP
jgi:NAD(P)-dependent dehydrogenase (short-subunit alcohol dehydrogenase family)